MSPKRTGLILLALLLTGIGGLAWWLGQPAVNEGLAGAGERGAAGAEEAATELTADDVTQPARRVEAAPTDTQDTVEPEAVATESVPVLYLRGRLLDPDGNPVRGSIDYLSDGTDCPGRDTNAFGEFVIPLQEGNVTVQLHGHAEGWLDSRMKSIDVETADVFVDLSLRVGGRITGEVLDDEGKPLPDEDVSVGGLELGEPDVTSDEDGRFVIEHVEPGDYFFLVVPKGNDELEHMLLANATVVEGETTHVVIGGVNENKVEVTGVVTRGGKPHKTQLIFMSIGPDYMGTMRVVEADKDGRYSVTLLRPGATRVLIEGSKGNATFLFDAPASTETVEYNIEIPGGYVSGRIYDPEGNPTSGKVSISRRNGSEDGLGDASQDFHNASGGSFYFDDLRPGRYVIRAKTPLATLAQGLVEFEVPPSEDPVEVDVHLTAACAIRGLVRGVDSTPVQGATVIFFDSAGRRIEHMQSVRSDSRGVFEAWSFPEGALYGFARFADDCSAITPLVASSEDIAEVELFLEPGAYIDARATDGSGSTLPTALTVTDAAGRSFADLWNARDDALTTMSREGRLVGPLQPGTYDIRAVHRDSRKASRRVTVRAGDTELVTLRL